MNRTFEMTIGALALWMLCSASAMATPTLNTSPNWQTGDVDNWSQSGNASVSVVSPGVLQISFLTAQPAPDGWVTAGSGASLGNFTGNYTNANADRVLFTLNTAVDPSQYDLALYFKSGVEGNTWINHVASGLVNYSVSLLTLDNWAGFDFLGWNQDLLRTDLSDVTEIGLYLSQAGDGTPSIYQLDKFELSTMPVPEPESMWMILAVALSLMITFRVRLTEMVSRVKARITIP
jgi:hypothetical protein